MVANSWRLAGPLFRKDPLMLTMHHKENLCLNFRGKVIYHATWIDRKVRIENQALWPTCHYDIQPHDPRFLESVIASRKMAAWVRRLTRISPRLIICVCQDKASQTEQPYGRQREPAIRLVQVRRVRQPLALPRSARSQAGARRPVEPACAIGSGRQIRRCCREARRHTVVTSLGRPRRSPTCRPAFPRRPGGGCRD